MSLLNKDSLPYFSLITLSLMAMLGEVGRPKLPDHLNAPTITIQPARSYRIQAYPPPVQPTRSPYPGPGATATPEQQFRVLLPKVMNSEQHQVEPESFRISR